MGACVSSTHGSSQESAMKAGLSFASKTPENLVIPLSPVKEKPPDGVPTVKSQSFLSSPTSKDFGSKDDMFFDSQPWLESDCEDDFYSVRGDFTPSRGSTPVHHNFSVSTPVRVNKPLANDQTPTHVPEPFPTDRKKTLLELFRESVREEQVDEHELRRKSANCSPYLSGRNSDCSSERTANGATTPMNRLKPLRSVQRCLPNLVSCSSFRERKKRMSLAISVNEQPSLSGTQLVT